MKKGWSSYKLQQRNTKIHNGETGFIPCHLEIKQRINGGSSMAILSKVLNYNHANQQNQRNTNRCKFTY
jgi:hypothetical protein